MELDRLKVGGAVVSRSDAFALARRYLTERAGWSHPSYDGYQQETALGALVDGDFLAPVLLNVPRISVRAYEGSNASGRTCRRPSTQSRPSYGSSTLRMRTSTTSAGSSRSWTAPARTA